MKQLLKIYCSLKKLSDINFERLIKAEAYAKPNLFDSNNNIYMTIYWSIDISSIITG